MLNFLCQGDVPVKNPMLPIDYPKKTTGRWKNRTSLLPRK
jgi:hypothetical protein